MIYLDISESIIQILSAIFVAVAGCVAVRQYILAKKQERYHHKKEKIHLAIDLAEYYKDNILAYVRELKKILNDMKLLEIVDCIEWEKIEFFDIHENESIFSKKQSNAIRQIRTEYGINDNFDDSSISYETAETELEDEEQAQDKSVRKKKEEGQKYVNIMIKILNNLEVFSMYFVHGIADKSVVYQPLHMSFLETVRLLYFDISYVNRNGERKYYVNTIKLFNVWKKKATKRQKSELASMRKIAKKGSVLKGISNRKPKNKFFSTRRKKGKKNSFKKRRKK